MFDVPRDRCRVAELRETVAQPFPAVRIDQTQCRWTNIGAAGVTKIDQHDLAAMFCEIKHFPVIIGQHQPRCDIGPDRSIGVGEAITRPRIKQKSQ